MKKKSISFLLVLVMIFSLLPGYALAAETEPVLVSQKSSDTQDDALHMRKSLYRNEDGTYDIVIESWATGEVDSQVVTEAIPTDFVLVLDQSGSMTERDMPAAYTPVAGPWTPDRVKNSSQTLYTKVTNADGTTSYYQVGCKDYPTGGLQNVSPRVRDFGRNTGTGITATINGNNIYAMDSTGAIYQVYRDTTAFLIYHNSEFYYIDAYGNRQAVDSQAWWGAWDFATNPGLSATNLYTMTGNNHGYGLYYKDGTGAESQVAESTTVSGTSATFYSGELYTTTGQNQTRLEALKTAVSGFVSTVEAKAQEDGVNHRIAIVGFASDGTNYNQSRWENTELLTGVNVSGTTGRLYNQISDADYRNALQDVTIDADRTDLNKAVNAIAAQGGTQAQYGFYMAENILEKRQVTTYTNEAGQTANRNTVVLFFTDGHPGNFDTDDTIAAANTVVDAAKSVKQNQWNTKVFSVGIFADGDDQPLTFALEADRMSSGQQQAAMGRDNYIRYDSGWLYFRGNKVTQTPYNDTIADYMTCVSSKYPGASNFLTHTGGTADTGAKTNSRGAENQDHVEYYMRVTDASGLQKAFEAIANTIDTSSTSATVNGDAVLRDTVYLEDFDVSGASVEAKSVQVEMVDGQVVETGAAGTAKPTVTESVKTNGRLSVTGFNYSELFTTTGRKGEKLVVTIRNVEPTMGGHLWSNSGDASIYPGADSADAVLGVASPEENIDRVTHIIDFNAQMIFADGVKRCKPVNTITNGEYKIADGKLVYQLLPDLNLTGSSSSLIMRGVDTALALSNDAVWTQYTAIPAGSVYYDDDLAANNADAVNVGDGSGYNAEISASSPEAVNTEAGTYSFTFVGTGIDVYCTTYNMGAGEGYIVGKIVDPEGNIVTNAAGEKMVSTMKNQSNTVRYNVPTISFHNLGQGEHKLELVLFSDSGYKLDGIRVYNPVVDQELYEQNDATEEQYATFVNLRETLVNNKDNYDVMTGEEESTDAVLGALFVDNKSKLSEMQQQYDTDGKPVVDASGNPVMVPAYSTQFDAYKANSPKHEIYLEKDNAIVFQLSSDAAEAAKSGNLWIGLSAPDKGKETGTVTLKEGKTIDVTSALDMYYPITEDMLGANNIVTITNSGDNLISVTNLKITGVQAIYETAHSSAQTEAAPASLDEVLPLVFKPITLQSVKIAANNGVDPDAPAVYDDQGASGEPEKPTWNDPMTLLKDLFKLLLIQLRDLFSGLGGW